MVAPGSRTVVGITQAAMVGITLVPVAVYTKDAVGADGILRLEFYDYDDVAGADGQWNFGTVAFDVQQAPSVPGTNVPEPASLATVPRAVASPRKGI
jgi:hypothetical protein